jgi:hypothetical protein
LYSTLILAELPECNTTNQALIDVSLIQSASLLHPATYWMFQAVYGFANGALQAWK